MTNPSNKNNQRADARNTNKGTTGNNKANAHRNGQVGSAKNPNKKTS